MFFLSVRANFLEYPSVRTRDLKVHTPLFSCISESWLWDQMDSVLTQLSLSLSWLWKRWRINRTLTRSSILVFYTIIFLHGLILRNVFLGDSSKVLRSSGRGHLWLAVLLSCCSPQVAWKGQRESSQSFQTKHIRIYPMSFQTMCISTLVIKHLPQLCKIEFVFFFFQKAWMSIG